MSMLRSVLDRESVVKSNLVERLVECVKELQLRYAAESRAALTNDEATNSLCWILEAVFIHGLKNHFLKSMSSVLNPRDSLVPEPSFWEFVLVFCHQEVIVQINQLTLIHTDIGRCRAWLRLAINEGLLISYMQLMLKDKSSLKYYYKPSAFLRDAERCDILKSYLYGIESYEFQLASNSSLLNAWNSGPLSLVGLWTSSIPNDSISQGIDVAQNMNSRELQNLPQLQQGRTPPKLHGFPKDFENHYRVPLLEEDEALRVILSSKHSRGCPSEPSSRKNSDVVQPSRDGLSDSIPMKRASQIQKGASTSSDQSKSKSSRMQDQISISNPGSSLSAYVKTENVTIKNQNLDKNTTLNNSSPNHKHPLPISEEILIQNFVKENNISCSPDGRNPSLLMSSQSSTVPFSAWNKDKDIDIIDDYKDELEQSTDSSTIASCDPMEEKLSYAALFENYNKEQVDGSSSIGSFLQHNSKITTSALAINSIDIPVNHIVIGSPLDRDSGFEFLTSNEQLSEMLPQFNAQMKVIANEVGMDTQSYRCKNCRRHVGMFYGEARVCGFDGHYYCDNCHLNDESIIPTRIILNWDFSRYNVSKQAKDFLQEIEEKPVFNVHEINPKLCTEIDECKELVKLRTKLLSISMYLRTCKDKSLMEEFEKDIPEKSYLYEEIYVYSISDLLNIPNRRLGASLNKMVSFGVHHITSCTICTQKGFVCEICKNIQVIFPFELEKIFKCFSCGAVYHKNCMNESIPCPRCERWKILPDDVNSVSFK